MKVRLTHAPYMARKIANDLFNNEHINMGLLKEEAIDKILDVLEVEISKEFDLEKKVNEMLDNVEDNVANEFEYIDVNYKQVFWMAKKKLAKEFDFILETQDRYLHISHKIINMFVDENLMDYNMSETVIKNIVFDSIMDFMQLFVDIEEDVNERISHYKRRLIPGTEDYDLVYQKLYEESLTRKGLM
jgi:hypothetical protein